MRICCATGNAHKLQEFREGFAASGLAGAELLSLRDFPPIAASPEDGATFADNAIAKARYYGAAIPGWLFADDSGLGVDALDGAPGVHSARYAGTGAGDAANNRLLLDRMQGIDRRDARFVCVIALAFDGVIQATFEGEARGQMLGSAAGHGGFGYDPLFYFPPLGKTFAELTAAEKLAHSHRGAALRQMIAYLAERR